MSAGLGVGVEANRVSETAGPLAWNTNGAPLLGFASCTRKQESDKLMRYCTLFANHSQHMSQNRQDCMTAGSEEVLECLA